MLVLKLCRAFCSSQIPTHISSSHLGSGSDGEVFELLNDPSKVIKFCVIYDTHDTDYRQIYYNTSNIINNLIQNPLPHFARVYYHHYLGEFSRDVVYGNTTKQQPFILHYYIMEKLQKLSDDERKVFHSILCHEDRNIKKSFSHNELQKILKELGRGLDFDPQKIIIFCDNLRKTPIIHNDIHVRNIMKDDGGNFKLIDFDRCKT